MLGLCLRRSRRLCFHTFRSLSSSAPSSKIPSGPGNHNDAPPPIPHRTLPSPLSPATSTSTSSQLLKRTSTYALLATILASSAILYKSDGEVDRHSTNPLYNAVDTTVQRSNESLKRVYHHIKQTGVAASVLWQSLRSVLSSANHEFRTGFELRVAALLADIAAANPGRRTAIVGAGGGAVVDWLLETVATPRDGCGTQAECARALAFLIADPNVCETVLGRPHAVPNLLRSMLVAAIMEIVTSSCDDMDNALLKAALPKNAETRDIAAAIEVIEEGGLHMDSSSENKDDDNGDKGIKGIGIKILDGATVLGLARSSNLSNLDYSDAGNNEIARHVPQSLLLQNNYDTSLTHASLASSVIPGLWDDLHCEHVAVPFAAWALANWAMASHENRCCIQDLDQDGNAIMTTLLAPERSVKWHGSLIARLLLEDHQLPLNDSVPEWSSSLLLTVSHATKNEDIPLALVALSAFLVSVERSAKAQKVVMDKGLHLLRDTVKHTIQHKQVQEMLAKALELLCTGDMQLSLEESQRWSGILLQWACGRTSSDTVRSSAIKILSHVLESHGPSSVAISQAWLAILLMEILGSNKISVKDNAQKKSEKVKTQVDQSNMQSAGQIANQLAGAVVSLAGRQSQTNTETTDTSPLADLLSLDPFVTTSKNQKKDGMPKIDAADSAIATLRGIKALTHICSQDTSSQEKISDFGILCLLRRFLLRDDYEKLAAMEAYDASRVFDAQEMVQNTPSESSAPDHKDQSSVRVPPTAHVRRHAARLLTILSLLPNVKKAIMKDESWCVWLEECACGKLPGCNDLKIQSYARATLLNISYKGNDSGKLGSGDAGGTAECPQYNDVIFFINPELPHWKCKQDEKSSTRKGGSEGSYSNGESLSSKPQQSSELQDPPLDVVFVHGLRGGPYKTWRISEDKSSTKSGLVEKIDQEAGKQGTFWPDKSHTMVWS
ncbi:hypothetical protein SAY86_029477 [Trapa natans]|uniref:Alpha/beta-Hydrolases superfamily protein n=1 Tax=Trapa natans TaxID=22666 RepID=A0AAN7MLG7_TRANT|nr:hypothetical protein SAY86_029477 [Trapa natans]